MTNLRLVSVNLTGIVETPAFGETPYAVDVDGRPFIPVGDGGIVLGMRLGDSVFADDGDHAAPGVTLVHPEQDARHALTSFACLGDEAVVRSGAAAGAVGRVLGKRGGAGRVITIFSQEVLRALAPGDNVMVRALGQGSVLPAALAARGAVEVNVAPGSLEHLGIRLGARISAGVRAEVPSMLVGNGIGRPVQMWDIDLTVNAASAQRWGLGHLQLGDLVAVSDLDVRHNIGYRRGWTTVGVIVHSSSRLPGHGPGLMPVLCAPTALFDIEVDREDHHGLSESQLEFTP